MKTKIRWEVFKIDLWDFRLEIWAAVWGLQTWLLHIWGKHHVEWPAGINLQWSLWELLASHHITYFWTHQCIFIAIIKTLVQNIVSSHSNQCWSCFYRYFMGFWTDAQSFIWLHTPQANRKAPGLSNSSCLSASKLPRMKDFSLRQSGELKSWMSEGRKDTFVV